MKPLMKFLIVTGLILLLMKTYLNVDPSSVGSAVLSILTALGDFLSSLFHAHTNTTTVH